LNLKSIQSAVLPLTRVKAELSRDSLVAEIYERLFEWIVSKLNEAVECSLDPDDCGYIAILDISGYESVAKNGFEQVNINYTNDKLQQLYNEMLYQEQEEYKKEFGWQPIEFDTDLKDLLAVIEGKPEGLLPLLDNVCYRQHASDATFVLELGTYTNSGTPRASIRKTRGIHAINPDTLKFGLHHAPGPVDYSAKGFVMKNRDILASSLENLMQSSKSLCSDLFSTTGQKGQTSVAKFYVEQLSDLMDAIRETDYSFIKCVKPNAQNKRDSPDKQYIADQVKWSGVIETLQVCSKGFPEHVPYDRFAERFASLVPAVEAENPLATTRRIVSHCLEDTSTEVAFGNSQLYLSMSALFRLNTLKLTQSQNSGGSEGDGWISKAKSAFGWLWKS
jgi:myosin heavy subunit